MKLVESEPWVQQLILNEAAQDRKPAAQRCDAPGKPASKIPERFEDPVTYELMIDPVVCSDGRTYDRTSAERLETSPTTRQPLTILVDNVALRGEIFEKHPEAYREYQARKNENRASQEGTTAATTPSAASPPRSNPVPDAASQPRPPAPTPATAPAPQRPAPRSAGTWRLWAPRRSNNDAAATARQPSQPSADVSTASAQRPTMRPPQPDTSIPRAAAQPPTMSVLDAAKLGRVDELQKAHRAGMCLDPQTVKEGDSTPAHEAARAGHVSVLKYLHSVGVDFLKEAHYGHTPALEAAGAGQVRVLEYLRSVGVPLLVDSPGWGTLAHKAAREGHVSVLKYLHSIGVPLDKHSSSGFIIESLQSYGGETPAHEAARGGHVSVLKYLRSVGVPLDVLNASEETPAHIAAWCGEVLVLEYLHSAGVPLDQPSEHGQKPVDIAANRVAFDGEHDRRGRDALRYLESIGLSPSRRCR